MTQNGVSAKVGIAGAGIIGLATGWQLARAGCSVTLFDRNEAGMDTSHVGAGMLAPNAEASFEELELMEQNRLSLEMFPEFLANLKDDARVEVPKLNIRGSMLVAVDQDDQRILKRLYTFRQKAGLEVEWLSGTAAREREPLLSPKVIAALWLPEDAEINNISLNAALKNAFLNCGGQLKEFETVERIESDDKHIKGLSTHAGKYTFDHVIVTAGAYSKRIEGIPEDLLPPLRPVKGQLIQLKQTEDCAPQTMIRSPRIYIVPKDDGRLLVGATSEEKGFDTQVTAGAIWYLLDEGWHTVPAIYECPKTDDMCGLRPATPDHKPVIGSGRKIKNLHIATGFFRHGFLLAPLASRRLCESILNGEQINLPDCFLPGRFNVTSQQKSNAS